jgi:tetratricopeptide (TPR) repeat protein
MAWFSWVSQLRTFVTPPAASATTRRVRAIWVKRTTMVLLYVAIIVGVISVVVFAFAPDRISFGWRYFRSSLAVAFLGLLVAGAALLAGAMLGFLFGIPRTLQDTDAKAGYQVNTNLEQISDWLTKIIVGVTLVELREIPALLLELNEYLAPALGGGRRGEAFAGTVIPYFFIAGFFLGYLGTRLYLAGAIVEADRDLGLDALAATANEELDAVAKVRPVGPDLAEHPLTASLPPAAEQLKRAADRQQVTLDDLGPETARALALTYYYTGEYSKALPFFERANKNVTADPAFSMQHAVALGESGEYERAVHILEQLAAEKKGVPEVYQLLGFYLRRLPERVDDSIANSERFLSATGKRHAGTLFNLAAAHAKRHKQKKDDTDRDRALQYLREAVAIDPRYREFANPRDAGDDFTSLPKDQFLGAIGK